MTDPIALVGWGGGGDGEEEEEDGAGKMFSSLSPLT